MNFMSSNAWVILSLIEKAIKDKINSKGVPLTKWDISIFRGILTGYNPAFIIDSQTKEMLIAADPKSADLIRPILRGKDIQRYGFKFADQWLIATFPSKKYDINKYPAIKEYLLSFGVERLEQTGKSHVVNGQLVKARKKTNNKWFETQDSIKYWDVFFKQKIIYPNMTKYLPFYLDDKGFFTNQKCFILSGQKLGFLTAFFNSKLFKFCFRDSFPQLQGGTRELSKIFFEKIPVITVDEETDTLFQNLVNVIQEIKSSNGDSSEEEDTINKMIYDLYQVTNEEIMYINSWILEEGLS